MTVAFHHQDRDSDATINWYLDHDTNPYNNVGVQPFASQDVSTTGGDVPRVVSTLTIPNVPADTYYLCAEITNSLGGFKRYDYCLAKVVVSSTAPIIPTPAITSLDPSTLSGLPLPQTQLLIIYGTGFIPESEVEFFDGSTSYSNRIPTYVSPTELRYNIKVGNVSANWTVKVINDDHQSAPAPFTVTAMPDFAAPTAPLNVTAAFAGGVNDDFYYVDWTDPSDASGLAKIWWKLGAPPTSPANGVGFDLPVFKPLPVSTLTTNPQTLYLWLEDGAGNKDHNNRSSVLLYRNTGAPFVVTPPQDRTVIEGASAVFSALAGGANPLVHQWQRNGTNIPGATGTNYVTPSVTLADSGTPFRVIITNAFGAVTSNPAMLNVNLANTITWVGGYPNGWNNPTNWTPQIVPSAGHSVAINTGDVTVPPAAAYGVLNLTGATLYGTFTNTGTINWTGGSIGSGAVLTVANNGVLNLSGSGAKTIWGVLSNAGTVLWSGTGNLQVYCGKIYNLAGGVFDVQNDQTLTSSCGATFFNDGLFRKSAGTGTTVINDTFNNAGTVEAQSGTVWFAYAYIQAAGTNRLSGGALKFSTPMYLNGGVLTGSGTIVGTVVNAAEVSPGAAAGTITVIGNYTQTAAGTLKIEIGGSETGTQHDRLTVNGLATLNGALQVSLINGFTPATGNFFDILGFTTRSGAFATSTAASLGLSESNAPDRLLLIAGSNAFPSLTLTIVGGATQTVCSPFGIRATAVDVDGAITNLTLALNGSPVSTANNSPVGTTAEFDFPGTYLFSASAQDDKGGSTAITQVVALVTYPLHALHPAGFRTNNTFKLCMLGETNRDYQIFINEDLNTTNWLPLGVMESTNGIWRFFDVNATNNVRRYYRVEQVP